MNAGYYPFAAEDPIIFVNKILSGVCVCQFAVTQYSHLAQISITLLQRIDRSTEEFTAT